MKENSKGEGALKMFEGELLSLQVHITLEKAVQPNQKYCRNYKPQALLEFQSLSRF